MKDAVIWAWNHDNAGINLTVVLILMCGVLFAIIAPFVFFSKNGAWAFPMYALVAMIWLYDTYAKEMKE